ncbi:dihydrodipicolinate synthase family protein [uncultured Martelella sp.]|uniref:dihydrodipicolinate synthase family protein n=1 Tax=uncultured Martelella sp. TaxID=392331 RepID=UPI0029C68F0D|nr:dihydrodipicolinate synthase family protein [uncultured Martelella sp.]
MPKFHGVIPPVSTLFTPDFRFDRENQAKLIDRMIEGGVHGLFFLGSNGESQHMPFEMRLEIAEFCIAHVAGRVPTLIGIGLPSTTESIKLGQHAAENGADAVVAINPFYARLSEDNLYRYFREIADNVDLPLMIYNFPVVTGQDLSPELVLRLALDCENIIGLKDTVDTLSHIRRAIHVIKAQRPDFLVFAGFDEYLHGTLIMGGDGVVPASANFAPQLTVELYEAYRSGDHAAAVAWQQKLVHTSYMTALEAPFYAVVKEGIRMVGFADATTVLPPASPASPESIRTLHDMLVAAGAIEEQSQLVEKLSA